MTSLDFDLERKETVTYYGAVSRDLVLFQKPKNVFGLTEIVK